MVRANDSPWFFRIRFRQTKREIAQNRIEPAVCLAMTQQDQVLHPAILPVHETALYSPNRHASLRKHYRERNGPQRFTHFCVGEGWVHIEISTGRKLITLANGACFVFTDSDTAHQVTRRERRLRLPDAGRKSIAVTDDRALRGVSEPLSPYLVKDR